MIDMDDNNNKRNIKLICRYDGTDFYGFQKQGDLRTVQKSLEDTLKIILKEPVKITGAGRTDSGVHAIGQVVNFFTVRTIPTNALFRAVNSLLPDDLRVWQIEEVEPTFHSRYSAIGKKYEYRICNSIVGNPMTRLYTYHIRDELDVANMNRCTQVLKGRHDFSAFEAAGSPRPDSIRTISDISCTRIGDDVTITVAADGFLYKMVRNIVGCLIDAGRRRLSPDEVVTILNSRDRGISSPTAPAKGLTLVEVFYR